MKLDAHRAAHDVFMARQSALVSASLLCFAGAGFAAILHWLGVDRLSWIYLAHATAAGAVVVLLWRRTEIDPRWSLAAFVALALPLLPIFWISQSMAVEEGMLWQPMMGRKLTFLFLALLTPWSRAAAAVLIVLFLGEGALLWKLDDLGDRPEAVASGEPWVTLLFFFVALALVAQRWRSDVLERRLLYADAEAEALRHVTRVSLAVRDRANTPLQTLVMSIALLALRHPEEHGTFDRMRRALGSLLELSDRFRPLHEGRAGGREGLRRLRAESDAGARLEGLETSLEARVNPTGEIGKLDEADEAGELDDAE